MLNELITIKSRTFKLEFFYFISKHLLKLFVTFRLMANVRAVVLFGDIFPFHFRFNTKTKKTSLSLTHTRKWKV